ncbi:MAG: hypothetical protein IT544_01630 [Rhodobacteraceae bacterium]|nr:hypothetical protein [Paracoccaceae bacterium]
MNSWAKIKDKNELSLTHHSADVAGVFRRLIARPVTRARLTSAAQRPALEEVTLDRLSVLAFLHDFGKANQGFQARKDPKARTIGHLSRARWLFRTTDPAGTALLKACGLHVLKGLPHTRGNSPFVPVSGWIFSMFQSKRS